MLMSLLREYPSHYHIYSPTNTAVPDDGLISMNQRGLPWITVCCCSPRPCGCGDNVNTLLCLQTVPFTPRVYLMAPLCPITMRVLLSWRPYQIIEPPSPPGGTPPRAGANPRGGQNLAEVCTAALLEQKSGVGLND